VHDALREQTRVEADRDKLPSAAITNDQSVKVTQKGDLAASMLARG